LIPSFLFGLTEFLHCPFISYHMACLTWMKWTATIKCEISPWKWQNVGLPGKWTDPSVIIVATADWWQCDCSSDEW
jgi:hypothetical protein